MKYFIIIPAILFYIELAFVIVCLMAGLIAIRKGGIYVGHAWRDDEL